MWTVPRVLVRRTASPAHADFGGLSSLAALAVVRLDVVPLPPRSPRRRWRVVGWADILLDVIDLIGGVESALREGCPRTMAGVCLLLQDLVHSCLRGGGGDMGGHVLGETTSRGLCGLGCPSRTSERGGEGDCVKEGGGGEGKCERESALERLRYYSPGH
jgi:hypothetical protein